MIFFDEAAFMAGKPAADAAMTDTILVCISLCIRGFCTMQGIGCNHISFYRDRSPLIALPAEQFKVPKREFFAPDTSAKQLTIYDWQPKPQRRIRAWQKTTAY